MTERLQPCIAIVSVGLGSSDLRDLAMTFNSIPSRRLVTTVTTCLSYKNSSVSQLLDIYRDALVLSSSTPAHCALSLVSLWAEELMMGARWVACWNRDAGHGR